MKKSCCIESMAIERKRIASTVRLVVENYFKSRKDWLSADLRKSKTPLAIYKYSEKELKQLSDYIENE